MKLIRQKLGFKQTAVDEENFVIRGKFSTPGEDRHGETIDQKGWQLKDYLANPVILFAHDHYQPAVAQCIELGIDEDGDLAGAIKFAAKEYDFAMTLFKLYAGQFMRAFSVGFQNVRYEIDQENDKVILLENILHEISCVNVPANAEALALSKGIDMEPVRKMAEKAARPEAVKKAEADKTEGKDDATLKAEREDEAVRILSAADKEKLRSVIRALTEALKDETEPDTDPAKGTEGQVKVEHPARAGGHKKIPVKILNRAVKDLLAIKKIN